MMAVTSIVFLTLVVCVWTAGSASDVTGPRSVSSLKFLFVVVRHGNRGAYKNYAQDPYLLSDPKYYPYGYGGLTTQGRADMHKLGKKVRALYDGFLNSTFYPQEIRATSSPTDRSLMSGQCFLAGLYPPQGFQVWNRDVLWQPVPLFSNSPDNAHGIIECQKYLTGFEKAKTDFYTEYASNVSEVMNHYRNATGSNDTDRFVWYVWDKLLSESREGYVLPEWTKLIYPNPLMGIMSRLYVGYYANTENLVRIISGNLVEEMMATMKNKVEGGLKKRRVHFYSGHDSSIVSLMVALGVPGTSVPLVMPGSALLLELHQDPLTIKHFVKVLYIDGGSVDLEPQSFTLPTCGDPCDFNLLLNNTSWLSGLDYDQECRVPNFDTSLIIQHNWT